ncbi:zinc ribbon domain-containing protein [Marispirochaeta aestuarii]|uniref:Nucleic acid-binding protein n=1 Tax=Marispirochaeta aestuarii TaxID=1963862 RepID=A0A1Y1S0B5_9SPIO|nr:C4-type zinc ribbon domain-containing protein [Marispirochaeta aestuarii]ORC36605.1 nucleic acid-binding protein [Marispirochaeta aestuarii]
MMTEVFDKLRTLQDILSQKYEIEREIHDIPKALTTKTELLNRLKKSYIEKNAKRERINEKIKSLRIKLSDAETQRETYEKQMDQITTQREYEALDKEIRDATEKEQQLRKDILREEKELEEINATLEREESMIQLQEEELSAEQEKIKNESAQKEEVLKQLESEEKDVIPGLDEDILFKFERIIRSKSGVGIVPVKASVCTGCHMQLPSQFVNDVRNGEKILFCPYCSRILFYSESEIAEDAYYFQDEDTGSLADLVDSEE